MPGGVLAQHIPPDRQFTVIVLSNLGTGNAGNHPRRIIDLFVEGV